MQATIHLTPSLHITVRYDIIPEQKAGLETEAIPRHLEVHDWQMSRGTISAFTHHYLERKDKGEDVPGYLHRMLMKHFEDEQ